MTVRSSRSLIAVGALQGLLLWWLWQSTEAGQWPSTQPVLLDAMLWCVLALPLAVYLSHDTAMPAPRRGVLLTLVAVGYALLGGFAAWAADTGLSVEEGRSLFSVKGSFQQTLGTIVFGFVLVPLVAGWSPATRRWDYARLFEVAWRNGVLCFSVAVLVGVFWMVLFAGSMLMDSIGLSFVKDLISESFFAIPATCIMASLAFSLGLARADMLMSLRRFWLSLTGWFLPLLLAFALMWVAALPFTGVQPLFKTQSAAFVLMWFAVLCVKFINSAWQDGREAALYPQWLATGVRAAWLTVPVVMAIAGWALLERVLQYGWTEGRIWAAFVWLLLSAYALGYALSQWPALARRGWMASIGTTNVAVALVMLLGLALLIGPVADPRRLAVTEQVDRLQQGKTTPEEFDYRYLRWSAGRWGVQALQQLSEAKGDARMADIASRAQQTMSEGDRYGNVNVASLGADAVRRRVRVLPQGASLDESFVNYLQANRADWRMSQCLESKMVCVVWLHDLDADGQDEALLITAHNKSAGAQVSLHVRSAGLWQGVGDVNNRRFVPATGQANATVTPGGGTSNPYAKEPLSLDTWLQAIEAGKVQLAKPRWPDLQINEQPMAVN
jgi:hypothetical protein